MSWDDMKCRCGQDVRALPALHRFVQGDALTGSLICRWCLIDEGRILLADPLLPRPSNPPTQEDKARFAEYERAISEGLPTPDNE